MWRCFALAASAPALVLCTLTSRPLAADYPRNGAVIGKRAEHRTGKDDSLYEIARRYGVGIDAVTAANPGVDPFIPEPHTSVVLPTEWILPDVPIRRGIVINVAERRLYYFTADEARTIATFPVAIGDRKTDTPLGTFTITEKIAAPSWRVPKSIRREKPGLPAVVPPGPENPMGSHALRLSDGPFLIHGTDRPWGIGARNSHGCIRMHQKDIASLFARVKAGTRVMIVNQPVKAAARGDRVFLEVHDYEDFGNLFAEAIRVLLKKKLFDRVDPVKVAQEARERTGLLVDVSHHGR